MSDISNLKDGSFFYVENIAQLEVYFLTALGGLITSIAENV